MSSNKRHDAVKEDEMEEKLSDGDLPEIVDADAIEWPENMGRITKYSKYDNIQPGQAIVGLSKVQAETIRGRLKKRGFKMVSVQMDKDTFGLKRES